MPVWGLNAGFQIARPCNLEIFKIARVGGMSALQSENVAVWSLNACFQIARPCNLDFHIFRLQGLAIRIFHDFRLQGLAIWNFHDFRLQGLAIWILTFSDCKALQSGNFSDCKGWG